MNRAQRREHKREMLKGARKFAKSIILRGYLTESDLQEFEALKLADKENLSLGNACAYLGYCMAIQKLSK